MQVLRIARGSAVVLACLGLLVPSVHAAGPGGPVSAGAVASAKPAVAAADVVLDGQGGLQGVVVDTHGAPRGGVAVVLSQGKRALAQCKTDGTGRFRVAGLRGGVYLLQADGQGKFVRAWTAKVAPPDGSGL